MSQLVANMYEKNKRFSAFKSLDRTNFERTRKRNLQHQLLEYLFPNTRLSGSASVATTNESTSSHDHTFITQ